MIDSKEHALFATFLFMLNSWAEWKDCEFLESDLLGSERLMHIYELIRRGLITSETVTNCIREEGVYGDDKLFVITPKGENMRKALHDVWMLSFPI